MSIYTRQVNDLMEQMTATEQRFVFEFIKYYNINKSFEIKEISDEKIVTPKEAIKNFIEMVNSAEDEVLDEEFDEIVRDRINITRELV